MIGKIEVTDMKFAPFGYHKNLVITLEFPKVIAASLIVEAIDIRIEPYLSPTQCGDTFLFELNTVNLRLGKDVTHGVSTFDVYLAEILFKLQDAQSWFWLENHLNCLSLSIGVGTKVSDA